MVLVDKWCLANQKNEHSESAVRITISCTYPQDVDKKTCFFNPSLELEYAKNHKNIDNVSMEYPLDVI